MELFLFRQLKKEVKNWRVSLITGVLFVFLSFFVLLFPKIGYVAIAIMFSIAILISGVMEVVFAISNKKLLIAWVWFLVFGVIDVLLGLLLVFIPGVKEVVIPFVLAFWLMSRGVSSIIYSFDLQRYGSKKWGWYFAFGLVGAFSGFGIAFFPLLGALSVIWIGSFIFFFLGLTRIMLAFDLKRLYEESKKMAKKIKSEELHW